MTGLDSIETRVAILENQGQATKDLLDRLDSTLDKLTSIASDLKQIVTLHENKIENQNVMSEDRRKNTDKDISAVKDLIIEVKSKQDKNLERLEKLENWRNWMTGAMAVISVGLTIAEAFIK